MARKTHRDRALIDIPIAITRTKSVGTKLKLIRDFETVHGDIPDELLSALARSEYTRGWDDQYREMWED